MHSNNTGNTCNLTKPRITSPNIKHKGWIWGWSRDNITKPNKMNAYLKYIINPNKYTTFAKSIMTK